MQYPLSAGRPAKPSPLTHSHVGLDADAIELLLADQHQIGKLFEAYAEMVVMAARADTRQRLVRLICSTLIAQDALEVELFYPAAREALANKALIAAALGDHASWRGLVQRVLAARPSQPGYDERVARLGRRVRDPAHFETSVIFASLRREGVDLGPLGSAMWRQRQLLQAAAQTPAPLGAAAKHRLSDRLSFARPDRYNRPHRSH